MVFPSMLRFNYFTNHKVNLQRPKIKRILNCSQKLDENLKKEKENNNSPEIY